MRPDDLPLLSRFDDPPMTFRGVLGGAALLVGLALAVRHGAAVSYTLGFVVENLVAMAPVIIFAVALAAGLRASGADTALAELVHKRRQGMVLAAALAGAVTPVCGVGVLPLIAALLRSGVPLAPVMAFWLASPVTDPAMFAITAATLGGGFALAKTALAFLIGLGGGAATSVLSDRGLLMRPLRPRIAAPCEAECAPLPMQRAFWRDAGRRALFAAEARAGLLLIGGWLAVAFAVESVIRAHLPAEMVGDLVGGDSPFAVPLAVAVGAPIYVDGYGALPLVRGLIDLGMSPGAAMGFLLAGGMVSLYASIAVFALVRLPVFLLYIALALLLSLIGAFGYQVIAG